MHLGRSLFPHDGYAIIGNVSKCEWVVTALQAHSREATQAPRDKQEAHARTVYISKRCRYDRGRRSGDSLNNRTVAV